MAMFAWDKAAAEELAATWDMLPGSVQDLASEASRRVNAVASEDEETCGLLKNTLRELIRMAMAGRRKDLRAAIEGCRVLAGVVQKKGTIEVGGDGVTRFVLELSTPMGETPPPAPAAPPSPPP
jgi:hypothetical protein